MARQSKLKVFRTPIGFHDAYVAAPSQKAALKAWGSDKNLFSSGAAERVEDPELMREARNTRFVGIRRICSAATTGASETTRTAAPHPGQDVLAALQS